MSIKKHREIWGITESLTIAKAKFVRRIEQYIFEEIEKNNRSTYATILQQLRWDYPLFISRNTSAYTFDLDMITRSDFEKTLELTVMLYSKVEQFPNLHTLIGKSIPLIIDESSIDLGIRWKDGFFYPSGEKLLDEKLVDDSLEFLKEFPASRKDLMNALKSHFRNNPESQGEVIHHCYLAMESLAQSILNNQKVLANNKSELLQKLKLSTPWSTILAKYIDFENEFGKHTRSEERHKLPKNEVEGYLYLTCLIIKLVVGSKTSL